jgi:glycosyltransferase involved in cell wall biosynthesis
VPAVSVCIPTYNYAHFLPQAIGSVLAQTYGDFELIVSDNASTDETQSVLASYDDPRIKLFRNDHNLGLFENFNRCLELATCDLVKFVCADDWLAPSYLEDAVAVMESHPEAALLSTPGWVVDEGGRVIGIATAGFDEDDVVPARTALEAQARHLNVIGMPTNVTMRRPAVEAAGGFDPKFAPASDVHLWLKLLNEHDLGWVNEPLCYLRVHASKGHDYGGGPSESTFLSWEDAARWPDARVGGSLLEEALYAEAERSLLYVAAHAARGRLGRAAAVLQFTGRHVRWSRVLPRFATRLPRLLRQQLKRIRSLRTGRLVEYGKPTSRS